MARTQVHSAQHKTHSQVHSSKSIQVNKSTPVQRQQPTNVTAQIYRPTPVRSHPDDGFESGAWLFNPASAPQWLACQLMSATTPVNQRIQSANVTKSNVFKNSNAQVIPLGSVKAKNASDEDGFNSGAWLFDASVAPQWLSAQLSNNAKSTHRSNTHVILAGSVKAKNASPDDAFDSGAWLFDASVAPLWLSSQLTNSSQFKTVKEQDVLKAPTRAQSTPSNHLNPVHGASVIKAGSIKAKNATPDDAFDSGAWLFDSSVAPHWLSSQLTSHSIPNKSSSVQRSVRPQSSPPSNVVMTSHPSAASRRPQSPRR